MDSRHKAGNDGWGNMSPLPDPAFPAAAALTRKGFTVSAGVFRTPSRAPFRMDFGRGSDAAIVMRGGVTESLMSETGEILNRVRRWTPGGQQ